MNDNSIKLELSYEAIENLKTFSQLLDKDINILLDEALSQYFENEQLNLIAI